MRNNIKKLVLLTIVCLLILLVGSPQTAIASGTFYVTAGVHVRASATPSSSSLTTVAEGTNVEVVEHDPAGWSKVRAGGVTGYIRSDFLKLSTGDASATFITTANVHLRASASVSSDSLKTVDANTSVEVSAHDPAGWSKVETGGVSGYIRSDFLKYAGAVGSSPSSSSDDFAGQLKTLGNVNMRTGASKSSGVIKVLRDATVVNVIENETNGWTKVSHNGDTGYIWSDLLAPPSSLASGSVNPLTGESRSASGKPWDESMSRNRPFAVSIGNTADAMPLWGIGGADVICEHVVETVATRILAIFQDPSAVGRIGGIRSLRTSNMEIAAGFDAIFTHWIGRTYDNVVTHGNPITAYETLDAAKFGSRDPSKNERNAAIVGSGKELVDSLPASFRSKHNEGFAQGFNFAENGTPMDGLYADKVTVSFSDKTSKKTEFTYNNYEGKYYASQFGRPLIDGNNNKHLSFSNVLILHTSMTFDYNASSHTYIRTTGEGAGYYVNGGKYTQIRWARESLSAPYSYYMPDGTPLKMGVGKTYICIVDDGQTPVFA